MDSTVWGFWLVYKGVFIALWSTKIMWAMWLIVSKFWEFTVCASYIVFVFATTENDNFIKEIKHIVRASIAFWKPRQSLCEFSSLSELSTSFTDLLLNSRQGKHVLFIKWSLPQSVTFKLFRRSNQFHIWGKSKITYLCVGISLQPCN